MPSPTNLPSAPAFFSTRCARDFIATGEAYGCTCAICGRQIAAPMTMQFKVIWCLYCGMQQGHVPVVEITPDSVLAFPFGLTAAEVAGIKAALNA